MPASTQEEIARRLGISQSLVSQILNGRRPVRSKIHQRILAEGTRLGYLPNTSAVALRTGRRHAWGILFPSFHFLADFNRQIVQGLCDVAHENHYLLSVASLDSENPQARDYMSLIREGRFDGVFLIFETQHAEIPFQEIHRLGVATTVINCPLPDRATHHVFSDGEDGVYHAVRHLIEVHGRRKIAYVQRTRFSVLMEDRYRGYVRAHAETGIEIDPRRVVDWREGLAYEEYADVAVDRLISEGVEFDAIYCPTDYVAIATMGALADHGIRVPDQVAVIGFDDHHLCRATRPRLTTVHGDGAAMGRKAAEIMLDVLSRPEDPTIRSARIPVSLVVRQSCGCGRG